MITRIATIDMASKSQSRIKDSLSRPKFIVLCVLYMKRIPLHYVTYGCSFFYFHTEKMAIMNIMSRFR